MSMLGPEDPTTDYAHLFQAILDGQEKYPWPWTRRGRALARWQKANPDEVRRIKHEALARQGVAPVVGEDAWPRAGARGFRAPFAAGLGSGLVRSVTPPNEFMMATNYAAGWNPNSVGSPSPMIGPPIGRNLLDGKDLGFDCLSWLEQNLLSTPSAFLMSVPGLGKSSLVRQILLGHAAQGHVPIVPNDLKGEYVPLARAIDGQVIRIGHGLDLINPLDAGALGSVVPVLQEAIDAHAEQTPADHERLRTLEQLLHRAKKEVAAGQRRMIETLVSIARQDRMADYESAAVAVALDDLYASPGPSGQSRWVHPPELTDLIETLQTGSEQLHEVTVASTPEEYQATVRPLLRSLYAMQHGVTGEIFSGQTTTKIDVDSPAVVIDVSALDDNDETVKAAVIMACWSSAAGAVTASKILADAGLRKRKLFAYTLDELWGTLAAAPGLTKHVDGLMRLLRTLGMAVYLVTHGSKDLETLPTEADRNRAMGFIDRAGAVICGGLPADELWLLGGKLPFTEREIAEITSWSKGAAPARGRAAEAPVPPGRGCFMIKASKSTSPGIPFRTDISPLEKQWRLHDTNAAFEDEWKRTSAQVGGMVHA
ncbi:ATPase [Dietzia sp. NCCP-2495]|uniref:ATP-binding protein n=1 Tax=Dietzia sp. NCCP-2495 TaxID=2934675 RepID=UPI00222F92BE|nr:ATP-binding protein [Dietzia sp. NCCP-2495]GLB65122.1 ATPase [Dietzia sp. NCCP-2495]